MLLSEKLQETHNKHLTYWEEEEEDDLRVKRRHCQSHSGEKGNRVYKAGCDASAERRDPL